MATSPQLTGTITADDVAESETERLALDRLREVTGETDGPMERHCLRGYLIGLRLAELRGADPDREVLFVAAMLHDIGLYDGASSGGVYVSDGAVYAEPLLTGREGWPPERIRRCLDAIERHHELRSQWAAGLEVELMRRADLVDVSAGLITHGAGRDWLHSLAASVRRDGTYREIGGLVLKAMRERPLSMPRIFVSGS